MGEPSKRMPAQVCLELTIARHQLGWTQRKAAAAAGVRQHLVSYMETGRTDPRLSTIARLAAAYGFELALAPADEDHTITTEGDTR